MNTSRAENPNFWKNSFVSMLKTKFKYNTGIFGKMLNVMDTYGCNGTGLEDVDRSFIMCDLAFTIRHGRILPVLMECIHIWRFT